MTWTWTHDPIFGNVFYKTNVYYDFVSDDSSVKKFVLQISPASEIEKLELTWQDDGITLKQNRFYTEFALNEFMVISGDTGIIDFRDMKQHPSGAKLVIRENNAPLDIWCFKE